jgi:DNA-nicking Smr family endonuclease
MAKRIKHLGDLGPLRQHLTEQARAQAWQQHLAQQESQRARRMAREFHDAVGDVTPLRGARRHVAAPQAVAPVPHQRMRDDRQVMVESVSDEIDVESLLDTDETLSWRRVGTGPDVLRKLRRGDWTIQTELDLHGLRVDEARGVVASFLREAGKRGMRCLRIVHGKGLGSRDRTPVLKGRVKAWLIQRNDVIAFCQARPAHGGAGALLVLLRPVVPAAKPPQGQAQREGGHTG